MKWIINRFRQVSRKSIIKYLVYVLIVAMAFTTTSLARYRESDEGMANAQIAIFAAGSESTRLTFPAGGMSPGSTADMQFTVTNYGDGKNSEVVLGYSVKIDTTGNLPLEFTLASNGEVTGADNIEAGPLDPLTRVATGGKMPMGSMERVTHSYTLTAQWPDTETDGKYSNEIDMITVYVEAQQLNPAG